MKNIMVHILDNLQYCARQFNPGMLDSRHILHSSSKLAKLSASAWLFSRSSLHSGTRKRVSIPVESMPSSNMAIRDDRTSLAMTPM